MRRLMILGMMLIAALGARAARRVNVSQLEQALTAALAEHRPDADIARQLAGFELTERLTDQTLDGFAAGRGLQPRTALALQLLADQSAFLDPPASEIPATAAPDAAAQQQILQRARAYAVETWSRLPNFFVSRVTTRFDDGAQIVHKGEWPVRSGLHVVGSTSRRITFRDGKEAADQDPASQDASGRKSSGESGLHSWGEFGPALTVVLSDLAGHRVEFARWELESGRLAAVFRYEVPREASHYAVTFSTQNQQVLGRTQFGYAGQQRSPQQVANIPRTTEQHTVTETPPYHGTIAIEPATGAVLRITIDSELRHGAPLLRAATAIDYAPVTIGERAFICPVRSLALSVEPGDFSGCAGRPGTLNGVGDDSAWQSRLSRCDSNPVLLINETRFTDYHRLGSTARILADQSAAQPAPHDSPGQPQANPAAPAAAPSPDPAVTASASAPPPAIGSGESTQPEVRSTTGAVPAPPSPPVVPEISMSAASGVPDVPAGAPPSADGGFSLRVTSRLVDVGIVAYDKKGRPVTDLKPEDFEVIRRWP